jgi:hypothetical protein
MFTDNQLEEILSIIEASRQCEQYELELYKEELLKSTSFQFESTEAILDDFDMWKEQFDFGCEKIIDANHWSSL